MPNDASALATPTLAPRRADDPLSQDDLADAGHVSQPHPEVALPGGAIVRAAPPLCLRDAQRLEQMPSGELVERSAGRTFDDGAGEEGVDRGVGVGPARRDLHWDLQRERQPVGCAIHPILMPCRLLALIVGIQPGTHGEEIIQPNLLLVGCERTGQQHGELCVDAGNESAVDGDADSERRDALPADRMSCSVSGRWPLRYSSSAMALSIETRTPLRSRCSSARNSATRAVMAKRSRRAADDWPAVVPRIDNTTTRPAKPTDAVTWNRARALTVSSPLTARIGRPGPSPRLPAGSPSSSIVRSKASFHSMHTSRCASHTEHGRDESTGPCDCDDQVQSANASTLRLGTAFPMTPSKPPNAMIASGCVALAKW